MNELKNHENKQKSKIPLGIFYGLILGFVMQNLIVGALLGILAAVILDSKAREN
ncbi:MAG: hypothetical protein GX769_00035 [Erysipelothrix sp.]|nr:hypothetical protein [Erysipelothrix sp.]